MKFTYGGLKLRKGVIPSRAMEYVTHRIDEDKLVVTVATRHIQPRIDPFCLATLTVVLSAPAPDVIRVETMHYTAQGEPFPRIPVCENNCDLQVEEDAEHLIFRSGNVHAEICKKPLKYRLAFYRDGQLLTASNNQSLTYIRHEQKKKNYMAEQLELDIGERIYGLGERFGPLVKNGQRVDMWNEDGGTSSDMAYKNIPFYLSNKGYGILVDELGKVSFEVGSEIVQRVQFSVPGEYLSYYIIGGETCIHTIEMLNQLTGLPALPPAWSFGLWLTTSFTTSYEKQTIAGLLDGMAERNIPLHVFHFDAHWMDAIKWCNFRWSKSVTDDPAAMLSELHTRGLKICIWINPYVAQASEIFDEGVRGGYFLKNKKGQVYQSDDWQPGMAIVDFTNPEACRWFQRQLKSLLDMGVDCIKADFGERIPVDVVYHNGADPKKMHNHYAYLYSKTVFELLEQVRGKGDAVIFSRAASIGQQRFPIVWGGDCKSTYQSMAETLRGGLSLACCGFPFWSHDISGFDLTATPDLYKRWCQFGLLSTHSRLHGQHTHRVPWLFDEESCQVLKEMVELKCRLMPYLYMQAIQAHRKGTPIVRPMAVEFQDDPACAYLDQQYMLGPSLMVVPVFREDGYSQYYLPEGKWTNLLDSRTVRSGWQHEKHGYRSLPLMVRPGTVLPLGAVRSQPDYDYLQDLELHVFQMKDGDRVSVEIPDLHGAIAATFMITMELGNVQIQTDSDKPYSVVVHT